MELSIDEFARLQKIGASSNILALLFEMRDLIVVGKRIDLIKLIRGETGLGLRPTKELVDVFAPQERYDRED